MANRSGTWVGFTGVPIVSPRAAPRTAAMGATVSRNSQWTCRCTGAAGMTAASGNTTRPASSACTAPAAIFSTATARTGRGAVDPVFDLAGVAELLHQRQGDRLHPLEDHRGADDTGHQQRGEGRLGGRRTAHALAILGKT